MKGFANDFALRELRQRRKLFRGEFLLLIFTALLLSLVLCMGDTISNTAVQRRFDAYGSWRYAAEPGANASGLEIRQEGTLTLYGKGQRTALIGSADEGAVEIGRIRVLAGRLPETENEIAAELSTLTTLGYSYDLGQEIELEVFPYLWDEDSQEFVMSQESVTVSYTLCGTLADRSSSWSMELPAIFLTDAGALRIREEPVARPIRLLDADELSETETHSRGLSLNKGGYPSGTLENIDRMMPYIVLLVCAVCVGLLLVTINAAVRRRNETWRTLRRLGAEGRSLFGVVLLEQAYLSAAALPIGFLSGILISWGLTLAARHAFRYELIFTFSWTVLLLTVGLSVLCALLGALIAGLGAARINMLPAEKTRKRRDRKSRGLKKLGPREMLRARRRLHPLSSLLTSAVVIGSIIVASALMIPLSDQIFQRGNYAKSFNHADFLMECCNFKQNPRLFFTTAEIESAKNVYGVEHVATYMITNYANSDAYFMYLQSQISQAMGTPYEETPEPAHFTLDLTDKQDDYYRFLEQEQKNELASEWVWGIFDKYFYEPDPEVLEQYSRSPEEFTVDPAAYPMNVFSPMQREDLERFVRCAECEETIDWDALMRGDACILALPALYEEPVYAPGSEFGDSTSMEAYRSAGIVSRFYRELSRDRVRQYRLQGIRVVESTAFRPGDVLKLSYGGETREIRVAGVLYSLPEDANYQPSYMLSCYSVIAGPGIFDRFPEPKPIYGANSVVVDCNENADYSATQVQMSRLLARLNRPTTYVSNNVQSAREAQTEFFTSCVLSALFIVLYLMVTVVLLGLTASARLEENRKRIATYKLLGADDRKIRKSFWVEGLINWLIGMAVSLAGLYTVWIVYDVKRFGFVYPLQYYFFPGSSRITFFSFPWGVFLAYAAAILLVVEFFQLRPLRKFFKQSPVEQLTKSE